MSWWSLIPIVGSAVDKYQDGKAAVESNSHAQEMATLQQFAAEFGHGRNLFDSLIDAVNRLPRPLIVGFLGYYLYLSWGDASEFARINAGLHTVPEPMWWFIGTVVGFFFGAREMAHFRKGDGFKAAAQAAVELKKRSQTAAEWLQTHYPDVQVKRGVILDGIQVERIGPILSAAQRLWHSQRLPVVITSAKDGKHKTGSKHYDGEAIDLRIWDLKKPSDTASALAAALGGDYDVVLEDDHIHVEYDPPGFFGGLGG